MVTSIVDSIIGSNADSAAAGAQTDANNAAIDRSAAQQAQNQQSITQQQQQNQQAINSQIGTNTANLQPYMATGASANNQLGYLLGLGGSDQSGGADGSAGSLAQPFTLADFQADPSYQFTLQQGQQALGRAQAAGGNYFSGAAIKGLENYNQNAASTQYQNAYNNYNTNQSNLYNRLAGVSTSGQTAATNLNSVNSGLTNSLNTTNSGLTNNLAGYGANAATQQGQLLSNTGGVQAGADLASAAGWQTGLNGLTNFGAGMAGASGGSSGYGTQGTTVQGLPWLTSNV